MYPLTGLTQKPYTKHSSTNPPVTGRTKRISFLFWLIRNNSKEVRRRRANNGIDCSYMKPQTDVVTINGQSAIDATFLSPRLCRVCLVKHDADDDDNNHNHNANTYCRRTTHGKKWCSLHPLDIDGATMDDAISFFLPSELRTIHHSPTTVPNIKESNANKQFEDVLSWLANHHAHPLCPSAGCQTAMTLNSTKKCRRTQKYSSPNAWERCVKKSFSLATTRSRVLSSPSQSEWYVTGLFGNTIKIYTAQRVFNIMKTTCREALWRPLFPRICKQFGVDRNEACSILCATR